MNALKKCSGWHGKCYHSDDKMVPVVKFTTGEGRCQTCTGEKDRIRHPTRPKHPITGEVKMDWKYRVAKSMGGTRGTTAWQSLLNLAEVQWIEEVDGGVFTPPKLTIVSNTPRFDDGRSATVTTSTKRMPSGATREGPGYVYIYQDARVPRDLKIGAEKVSGGRLKSAGTWGLYTMLYNLKFDRRFEAEKAVHDALHQYRMYSNKELFAVDLDIAIDAIETVALSHTTEIK